MSHRTSAAKFLAEVVVGNFTDIEKSLSFQVYCFAGVYARSHVIVLIYYYSLLLNTFLFNISKIKKNKTSDTHSLPYPPSKKYKFGGVHTIEVESFLRCNKCKKSSVLVCGSYLHQLYSATVPRSILYRHLHLLRSVVTRLPTPLLIQVRLPKETKNPNRKRRLELCIILWIYSPMSRLLTSWCVS